MDERNKKLKAKKKMDHAPPVAQQDSMKVHEDFSEIFLFKSQDLYFRAVEVGIMFNSLYLAMWATNMITIVNRELEYPEIWQIGMCLPLVVVLPTLGNIVKVASNLWAISDLQLDVISSVLETMEDRLHLIEELREKVLLRVGGQEGERKEIVAQLFEEIDRDHSGEISSSELRDLLRALRLHYSDDKFRRLYKGLDFDQDGSITLDELNKVLFPEEAKQHEMELRQEAVNKFNSHNASKGDILSKQQSQAKQSFIAKLSRGFSIKNTVGVDTGTHYVEMGDVANVSSPQSATNNKCRNFATFFNKSSSSDASSSVLPLDPIGELPRPTHTSSITCGDRSNKSTSSNIMTSEVDFIPPAPRRSRGMSEVSAVTMTITVNQEDNDESDDSDDEFKV
jgi:Ca2+-binding EF-hand superfamily protein